MVEGVVAKKDSDSEPVHFGDGETSFDSVTRLRESRKLETAEGASIRYE